MESTVQVPTQSRYAQCSAHSRWERNLGRPRQIDEIGELQTALEKALSELARTRADLKQVQEKYQALVQFADDAFLIVDFHSGVFTEVNDAACRMLGYSPTEFRTLTGRQLHPPDERRKVDGISSQINATGKATNRAMRFQRKDGSVFWGSVRMWTYEVGGTPLYVCIIRDVTTHVDREEELARSVRELRETQSKLIQAGRLSAMGALGAGIAHELNQPLTAIQGFAQRMMRRPERPVTDHLDELELISSEAMRMARIVDNIRTFARASDFAREPLEPMRPVHDAMMLIMRQLKSLQIQVSLPETQALPPIHADRAKLQQVFLNLLINARDALVEQDDGEKRIEVHLRLDGRFVVFDVDDSGPGVPAELKPRLFDPFVTTKAPGKGTGLGLSIIYGILADHDGDIVYSRSPLGGARFTLRIPTIPVP